MYVIYEKHRRGSEWKVNLYTAKDKHRGDGWMVKLLTIDVEPVRCRLQRLVRMRLQGCNNVDGRSSGAIVIDPALS